MSQTAITNIRIFNGHSLTPHSTLIITGPTITYIGNAPNLNVLKNAIIIDGSNHTLLPGLIDAHVHIQSIDELHEFARYGVTTALDMCTFPVELVEKLRLEGKKGGVCEFTTTGVIACAGASRHACLPGLPRSAVVADSPEDAARFVQDRVDENSDYIKIIADVPGFQQETLNSLVSAAHEHNKLAITHATSILAVQRAITSKADVITHIPADSIFSPTDINAMIADNTIAIPTLTMMKKSIALHGQARGWNYENCKACVKELLRSGLVKVLAGTDANMVPGVPTMIRHGSSLHEELGLLVEAGMGNAEAIRSATVETAGAFGFEDRGRVEVGLRADLLLVEGDPLESIRDTGKVVRVWCKGVEVEGVKRV